MMMRRICLKLACPVALAGIVLLACAMPAFAASPWWHLALGSTPTYLHHSGLATDEVQDVTVGATEGKFTLLEPVAHEKGELFNKQGEPEFVRFSFDATAGELQAGLETLYGVGSVQVAGGPKGAGEEAWTYVITFTGSLADQPLKPIFAKSSLEGGREELKVSQAVSGRPDGEVVVTATNLGDANVTGSKTAAQITDTLPHGLKPVAISGRTLKEDNINEYESLGCVTVSLTCTFAGTLPPYQLIEVHILVMVEPGASSGEVNEASVSGGEAPDASIARPITVSEAPVPFGLEDYELTPEAEGGAPVTQAGAHPFQLTTTLVLNQLTETNPKVGTLPEPAALTKDLNVKLPPGLIGNPTPFARCTIAQFSTKPNATCPPESIVGVAMTRIEEPSKVGVTTLTVPLFNLEPSAGEPARFGFLPQGVPAFIDTAVRTGGDYGITASVDNITQSIGFLSSEVTFWGVPGDPSHDNARGYGCLAEARGLSTQEVIGDGLAPCRPLEESGPPPFLSMPTSCTGVLQTSVEADSWAQPGRFVSPAPDPSEPMSALDGCNRLPFGPSLSVVPDGQQASTPSGLSVAVHVPQEGQLNATGLANSNIKDIAVTLPAGVTINPAGADGLEACSEGFVGYLPGDSSPPSELRFTPKLPDPMEQGLNFCANASKIATVTIHSPLLPNPVTGFVYLAAQTANPFGSLVAMYIVAEDPVSGFVFKAAGEVKLNQQTGQIEATFENTPQLAFEEAELHFFGGERAPLATPAHCGTYTTEATFTPWSGNEPVRSQSTFQITTGPNGSPCPGAALPFSPSLTAGTTNNNAAAFSPLTTTISREDGQQSIQTVQLHMPAGLSGILTGVKLCGEAQANAGTCGPESLIGSTIVSVGLGGDPYSVTGGKVYLTEKYAGAPFGLSIVNPAVAGPYNLGQVIVRAKVEVDPHTAALTVTTSEIPHILDGIPLEIKHVNVTIERPGFTFNPTNCTPTALTGSINSAEGSSSPVSVPFQVTNCASLKFAPKFAVSTSGKTSKAYGASLTAKLAYPTAAQGTQANIARVKVDLPKQLPSRLTTLQKACTNAQFEANPADCPSASKIGYAKVTTPLLPVPLEGPAIFVSHGGEAFPSLTMVLQGYGVTVDLVGTTFISHAGITSTTFKTVPDVPFNTFALTLPEGKYSALAANGNLCTSKLAMPTEFLAQNGAVIKGLSTPITVSGCARTKPATRAQKLTKALKACKRDKNKGKRTKCEKTARRESRS